MTFYIFKKKLHIYSHYNFILLLMGCFLTLRIKPIYSSYAEIEIVKDDNSGIAKSLF